MGVSSKRLTMLVLLTTGVAFIVIAGFGYNLLANRYYRHFYPPPGQLYSVDGYRMHLYCEGKGSPTLVIEGGLGSTWIDWQKVQPDLAQVTRVCTYDRAGLGWSEPRPAPRDAIAIANQLHELLQVSGIVDSLILMGQSAGGLFVREYAAMYPQSVVGLVLVDATPPESFALIPSNRETADQFARRHRAARLKQIKVALGWSRLLGQCKPSAAPEMQRFQGYLWATACRREYEVSWLVEVDDFEKSAAEVANTTFDDLPLVVISQDPDRPKKGWDQESIAANPIWATMQENLKTLSKRSVRIIAKGSGHHVERDRPDVINAVVAEMIQAVRGSGSSLAYGSTSLR